MMNDKLMISIATHRPGVTEQHIRQAMMSIRHHLGTVHRLSWLNCIVNSHTMNLNVQMNQSQKVFLHY